MTGVDRILRMPKLHHFQKKHAVKFEGWYLLSRYPGSAPDNLIHAESYFIYFESRLGGVGGGG